MRQRKEAAQRPRSKVVDGVRVHVLLPKSIINKLDEVPRRRAKQIRRIVEAYFNQQAKD